MVHFVLLTGSEEGGGGDLGGLLREVEIIAQVAEVKQERGKNLESGI